MCIFNHKNTTVQANKVTLLPSHLEQLLHVVVFEHGRWHVGGAAHLFRKVSLSILSSLLVQDIFPVAMWVPHVEGDPYSDEVRKVKDDARNLLTELVDTWRNALDADDAELRLVVVKMSRYIMRMPILEPDSTESIKELLQRYSPLSLNTTFLPF